MTMGDPGAVRPHPARLVAAVLCLLAAMTAITGSFLPVFSAKQIFGDDDFAGPASFEIVITAWDATVDNDYIVWEVPENGLPIVFSGIVLAGAALVCRRAAGLAASPRVQRMAGLVTVFGGAFLVCAVWMVVLQVNAWAAGYDLDDVSVPLDLGVETSYLAGLWIMVGAAVLSVVAVVLSLLPVPQPEPEVVDPDAPTPPFGIVLPVPEEPPVRTVDALTGEPTAEEPSVPELGPIVVPDAPPPQERPKGPAVPLTDDPLADPRDD